MQDDDKFLLSEDVGFVARATVDKVLGETAFDFLQFADVVALDDATSPVAQYATVHVDGDEEGSNITVASLIPASLAVGDRVAILFDRPHGAYIIGTTKIATTEASARLGFCGETDQTILDTALSTNVAFCCVEWESSMTGLIGGAFVGIQVGADGLYTFHAQIPFERVDANLSALGDITTATLYVYDQEGAVQRTAAVATDSTAAGTLTLTGMAAVQNGGRLAVFVSTGATDGITISDNAHFEVNLYGATTEWATCLPPVPCPSYSEEWPYDGPDVGFKPPEPPWVEVADGAGVLWNTGSMFAEPGFYPGFSEHYRLFATDTHFVFAESIGAWQFATAFGDGTTGGVFVADAAGNRLGVRANGGAWTDSSADFDIVYPGGSFTNIWNLLYGASIDTVQAEIRWDSLRWSVKVWDFSPGVGPPITRSGFWGGSPFEPDRVVVTGRATDTGDSGIGSVIGGFCEFCDSYEPAPPGMICP